MESVIIFILQVFGIASFSAAATLTALRKNTDMIGALILAFTTSFGGGIMRDIFTGHIPPHLFTDYDYMIFAVVCTAVSLVIYHLAFIRKISDYLVEHRHFFLIEFFDTVGIALFSVSGSATVINIGGKIGTNNALVIFCGVITAVGGGVLRDLLLAEMPGIFKKYVYLLPCLAGAAFYVYLHTVIGELPTTVIAASIIICIRIPAILLKWTLPTPQNKFNKGTGK
ncbi:MAG: TRIC cation channel family protein [Firmicutes bacterium]|nr:TRIC cation channel family protein [Candidatus Colimorpha enterica]